MENKVRYEKTKNLDLDKTFFHFTRIDSRNIIHRDGLKAIAGGENEAGNDKDNATIYFAYGSKGMLKAVDAWIKWEYNKLRKQSEIETPPPYEKIDDNLMAKIYEKVYDDFKNRNYYTVDFIEGVDPETSDFSFDDTDAKKQAQLDKYDKDIKEFGDGKVGFLHSILNKALNRSNEPDWHPTYPSPEFKWMYGSYSTFDDRNVKLEDWNMNTRIGERTIEPDRFKIIESENGRTDGLSILFEMHDKLREQYSDIDLSQLDDFVEYAKDRAKTDPDYEKGNDPGRRAVDPEVEKKLMEINKPYTEPIQANEIINEEPTHEDEQIIVNTPEGKIGFADTLSDSNTRTSLVQKATGLIKSIAQRVNNRNIDFGEK